MDHTPMPAGYAARLMRRLVSAIRAILQTGRRKASSGPAENAETQRQRDGVMQLAEIEIIRANLRHLKKHDPRRGQMTAKARSLRHSILRGR